MFNQPLNRGTSVLAALVFAAILGGIAVTIDSVSPSTALTSTRAQQVAQAGGIGSDAAVQAKTDLEKEQKAAADALAQKCDVAIATAKTAKTTTTGGEGDTVKDDCVAAVKTAEPAYKAKGGYKCVGKSATVLAKKDGTLEIKSEPNGNVAPGQCKTVACTPNGGSISLTATCIAADMSGIDKSKIISGLAGPNAFQADRSLGVLSPWLDSNYLTPREPLSKTQLDILNAAFGKDPNNTTGEITLDTKDSLTKPVADQIAKLAAMEPNPEARAAQEAVQKSVCEINPTTCGNVSSLGTKFTAAYCANSPDEPGCNGVVTTRPNCATNPSAPGCTTKVCPPGYTGTYPSCIPPYTGGGLGGGNGNSSGGSGSGQGSGSGSNSFLQGLMSSLAKGLGMQQPPPPPPPPQQPPQQCATDPNAQQQQQQQYQYQMQQYQYQLQLYQQQQYQQQLQQMQSGGGYGLGGYGGYPQPQMPMPQQPQQCTPANQNQCQQQIPLPNPESCTVGTWQPQYNGACIVQWHCVPKPGGTGDPEAKISCQPQIADVGMTLAITFSCANSKTSEGEGFSTDGKLSGSATTVVTAAAKNGDEKVYQLTCANAEKKTSSAQCKVQVSKTSIVLIANPQSVASGEAASVGWVTTGMKSCIVSSPDLPDFTAKNAANTSVNGMASTGPITSDATIDLKCTTAAGSTKTATTKITVK